MEELALILHSLILLVSLLASSRLSAQQASIYGMRAGVTAASRSSTVALQPNYDDSCAQRQIRSVLLHTLGGALGMYLGSAFAAAFFTDQKSVRRMQTKMVIAGALLGATVGIVRVRLNPCDEAAERIGALRPPW